MSESRDRSPALAVMIDLFLAEVEKTAELSAQLEDVRAIVRAYAANDNADPNAPVNVRLTAVTSAIGLIERRVAR